MWPFPKRPAPSSRTLREVLADTERFLVNSEESDWACANPSEIIRDLRSAIQAIEEKREVDASLLRMHFAPTSSIQETAMWNRWSDEYLRLSSEFDELIGKPNKPVETTETAARPPRLT